MIRVGGWKAPHDQGSHAKPRWKWRTARIPRWIAFYIPAAWIAIVLSARPTAGRTWTVFADGTGDAATIQAGIDSAAAGDTVLVAPGTYFEQIIFRGRDIVVHGAGAASTILDASQSGGSVAVFRSGESIACVLEGFTLTGGHGTVQPGNYTTGGAIVCLASGATIQDNIITGNEADWGGGICIEPDWSAPTSTPSTLHVLRNTIENNRSFHNGAGLFTRNSYLLIDGNLFRGNESGLDGGGISCFLTGGGAVISNNRLIENLAGDKGGAIDMGGLDTFGGVQFTVEFNVVVRNTALGADAGDAGAGGGIFVSGKGTLGTIRRNTIAFNTGVGESTCGGGGIDLLNTTESLVIEENVVAFNVHCGVACKTPGGATSLATWRRNLLWGNGGGDLGEGLDACPADWTLESFFVDPQFCNPALDNYQVAGSSPALTLGSPIGAYSVAGCPPVAVAHITWGRLKSMYLPERN